MSRSAARPLVLMAILAMAGCAIGSGSGGREGLRDIQIDEIRYLTRTYALQRYRVNSPAGVILVISPPLVGPGPGTKPDTGRVFLDPHRPSRRPS